MKENQEPYGGGMGLTRTIGGKRVHLNMIKRKDVQRMDMVCEMAARHARLLVEQDWLGLHQLANQYEALGAMTTANKLRLEIPADIEAVLKNYTPDQIDEWILSSENLKIKQEAQG